MTNPHRRRFGQAIIGLAALLAATAGTTARAQTATAGTGRYANVVNNRFATISSGPQSVLVVDVDAATTRAAATPGGATAGNDATERAVRAAVHNLWRSQAPGLRKQLARYKTGGLVRKNAVLPLSTIVVERQNGQIVLPAATRAAGATRAYGGGTLTFQFSGFTASDQASLQDWLNTIYPFIVDLYGSPATSGQVTIVDMGTGFTDVQGVELGYYDVSKNQINIPDYSNAGRLDSMRIALLVNVLHAFHGPAFFQYDAWEQGFARAAASILLRNPTIKQYLQNQNSYYKDDPSAVYLLSLLSYYDLLNQPALGNSTFFPATQANAQLDSSLFGKMFLPRLSMSSAAWMKVYVENTGFFQQFNNAYYAQVGANAGVAGNVPALRSIASGIVPQVEGLAFNDWYTRQYVLDTSVTPGTKLYGVYLPGDVDTSTGILANSIVLTYFTTLPTGDEKLGNGTAYATYLDETNAVNSLGPASETTTLTDGEGLLVTNEAPTSADLRRIAAEIVAGQATTQVYLPEGFTGDFKGVLLGTGFSSGTVSIQQQIKSPSSVSSRSATANLQRAAFGATLGYDTHDLAATTITVTTPSATTTYRVNTGDGLYYAILRTGPSGGGVVTVSHQFPRTDAPRIVAFPVTPFATSPDQALGLATSDFLLTNWNTLANQGAGGYNSFNPGTPSFPRLEPGRGYLLKVGPQDSNVGSVTVQMTGAAVPTDIDYAVSAPFGWSLVGSPFAADIDIHKIHVQVLQNVFSWDDAVTNQLIAAQPWDFVDENTGYVQVSTLAGLTSSNAWRGYWVRSYVPAGVTLLLPGPDAPARAATLRGVTRAAAVPTATPKVRWQVDFTANQAATGGMPFTSRATASLGAADGASGTFDPRIDREEPPALAASVLAEFARTDWRSAGGHYVSDFRAPTVAEQGATWNLRITTPASGKATLSWSGVGTLPRRTRLTLVDTATGARTPLRGNSSYTWAGEAGKTRAFQIVAGPERSLPLAVTNVQVTRTRAAAPGADTGINFAYTILGDREATVDVTVATITGKILRHLDSGAATTRSAAAGVQQTIHWDGRAEDGSPLPVGSYLLTITAHGSDGSVVRQMRPVLITR